MKKEIEDLLEKELVEGFEELQNLYPYDEKYSRASDNVAKLYKIKIESDKNESDKKELRINRTISHILEGASIILPLGFYSIWMNKGLEFEKTGTFTSNTFRGLISNFRPRRK